MSDSPSHLIGMDAGGTKEGRRRQSMQRTLVGVVLLEGNPTEVDARSDGMEFPLHWSRSGMTAVVGSVPMLGPRET